MNYIIEQKAPTSFAEIDEPTQTEILKEPLYRRATADFVEVCGGPIALRFLEIVRKFGMVTEKSRFISQRSVFVNGAYPSSPSWHFDVVAGVISPLHEHLSHSIRTVIACICSSDFVSTTEFIVKGIIKLEDIEITTQEYKGGEYLTEAGGDINGFHWGIEDLRNKGDILISSINPNTLYFYDSTYLHKAPQFLKSGGCRLILRVTTPPESFVHEIPTSNIVIPDSGFYFTFSKENRNKYEKHRLIKELHK